MFDALKFDPDRVSVSFDATSTEVEPESLLQRRYTLTHNDVTRNLTLTVGTTFNDEQTSVWYTRLLRDEVLAEWREDGLHVFCQVSANEAWWIRWAAPFRAVVFRQKLPLVLDTLRYAEIRGGHGIAWTNQGVMADPGHVFGKPRVTIGRGGGVPSIGFRTVYCR